MNLARYPAVRPYLAARNALNGAQHFALELRDAGKIDRRIAWSATFQTCYDLFPQPRRQRSLTQSPSKPPLKLPLELLGGTGAEIDHPDSAVGEGYPGSIISPGDEVEAIGKLFVEL